VNRKAMSARRLNIGIRSGAERLKALREAMRRVAQGDRTPQGPGLYFENVEELRRMMTEKRLELLLAITRHRPAPVRELAGLVGVITRTSARTSCCLNGSASSAMRGRPAREERGHRPCRTTRFTSPARGPCGVVRFLIRVNRANSQRSGATQYPTCSLAARALRR